MKIACCEEAIYQPVRSRRRVTWRLPTSMPQSDNTQPVTVPAALAYLLINPGRLLLRWNWKTATLSACARGTLFFISNLGAGLSAAIAAMIVEAALFATLAGFYGAVVQTFRRAQPAWAATMTVLILTPTV